MECEGEAEDCLLLKYACDDAADEYHDILSKIEFIKVA